MQSFALIFSLFNQIKFRFFDMHTLGGARKSKSATKPKILAYETVFMISAVLAATLLQACSSVLDISRVDISSPKEFLKLSSFA